MSGQLLAWPSFCGAKQLENPLTTPVQVFARVSELQARLVAMRVEERQLFR